VRSLAQVESPFRDESSLPSFDKAAVAMGTAWVLFVVTDSGIDMHVIEDALVESRQIVRHGLGDGAKWFQSTSMAAQRYDDELWLGFRDASAASWGKRECRIVKVESDCTYTSNADDFRMGHMCRAMHCDACNQPLPARSTVANQELARDELVQQDFVFG
jgi:hypothetical protein